MFNYIIWIFLCRTRNFRISKLVESKLDYVYEIPMKFESIDSLNASVAASIAMFQMFNID